MISCFWTDDGLGDTTTISASIEWFQNLLWPMHQELPRLWEGFFLFFFLAERWLKYIPSHPFQWILDQPSLWVRSEVFQLGLRPRVKLFQTSLKVLYHMLWLVREWCWKSSAESQFKKTKKFLNLDTYNVNGDIKSQNTNADHNYENYFHQHFDLSCIFLSYPNYFTYITVVILTESQFYIF